MPQYVLTTATVRSAIDALDSRRIHPHFPAYLGLTRLAKQEGTTADLRYDYDSFYDRYFRVQADEGRTMTIDGSEKPYLVPFTNPATRGMWKNENVAGSISAGTAARATADVGLNNVVDIDTDLGTYSLLENHWELARDHLTYEERVPVQPVAVFLYRDFGFQSETSPSLDDVVEIFREEFGFTDEDRFTHLFTDDYEFETTPIFTQGGDTEPVTDSSPSSPSLDNWTEEDAAGSSGDFEVLFPEHDVTVTGNSQATAMVNATNYLIEEHNLTSQIDIPWVTGRSKAIINNTDTWEQADPVYKQLTDGNYLDTRLNEARKKKELRNMAEVCGLEIDFGGQW